MADITKEQVIDFLSNMPVMEMAGLVKELEDKWGVTAAAPVAVAAAGAAADAGPAEEKTEFDVELKSFGDKKIAVIKVVREVVPGLGLKEAKSLVEGAPAKIKEGVSKEEADEIVKKLKDAGGDAAAV